MTVPESLTGDERSLPSPPLCATFRGRVQGVGFRFTTRRLAGGYRVDGTVRNLPDGSVELCVDGAADEVARFLRAIETALAGNIEAVEIAPLPNATGFSGFRIVR